MQSKACYSRLAIKIVLIKNCSSQRSDIFSIILSIVKKRGLDRTWRLLKIPISISGVGWDSGSVPRDLKPGGTQATFSEGQLQIDSYASSLNVTALVGKQAILSCFIRNVNNHSVKLNIKIKNYLSCFKTQVLKSFLVSLVFWLLSSKTKPFLETSSVILNVNRTLGFLDIVSHNMSL